MTVPSAIPWDRLLEAATAIEAAAREAVCDLSAFRASNLMGATDQPSALCDFTRAEVEAAEEFLGRCGYLIMPDSSHRDRTDNP